MRLASMRRAAVARRPEGRCRHIWCMQVKIRGAVKTSRTVVHVSARQVIHLATNAPDLTIRAFRILLSALLHPYEVCAAHTCRPCEAVPDSTHHFRWYCALGGALQPSVRPAPGRAGPWPVGSAMRRIEAAAHPVAR